MSILEKINSPEDVKRLDEKELPTLAAEIRKKIIETVAENGGHLASNLGMVEAEIALHRVFSCPEDSLIFDVGHQAYAHKLLTGRRDVFCSLRQDGGMSGFTNRTESEYDTITAGHGGTALSSAVGVAEAKQLVGSDAWTVAIVGDGSFTNGMTYEALNQLYQKKLKLVLLVNDNEMSISKNVGGVSNYFSGVRTSKKYFAFKMRLKRCFMAFPFVGKHLVSIASSIRDFIKRLVGAETWFESMGLSYIGPVDGNDIGKLCSVLEEAKNKKCPVVVYMVTKKGRGYAPAEEHPESFHSTSPFNESDGSLKKEKSCTFTDEFSDILCERAAVDKGIVAVTAAMAEGCGLSLFRGVYEDRFFDVGIAEEHAVSFASGLSIGGHGNGITPVLVMYSTFSQRVFDQLWHDFCLQNEKKNDMSLVLMLSHAGLVPGDGVTHQGIYDVALLSRLPGVVIWSPDTYAELRRAFVEAVSSRGLTVLRYPKDCENIYDVEFQSRGVWKECSFGESGGEHEVVVTYGRISSNVVKAAGEHSREKGKRITVAVLERIVSLPDDERFLSLIKDADTVVFVEEGVRSGGVGEKLAAYAETRRPVKILAIDESYIRCGTKDSLMRKVGLDIESLKDAF